MTISLSRIFAPKSAPEAILEPPPESKKPLVLLAEDNETNIITMVDFLTAKGYRVTVAHNGIEAVGRAVEEKPDIILMDVQMPVIDGLEATRRIRAEPELSSTPIIALTARAMPGDKERCLAAGVDLYLNKPVRLRRLLKVMEERLNR